MFSIRIRHNQEAAARKSVISRNRGIFFIWFFFKDIFELGFIVRRFRKTKVWIVTEYFSVKTYYKYSNRKAKEALSILSIEQLDEIKRLTDKGGVDKNDKSTGFS